MRYLLASLLLLWVACSDDEVRPPLAIDAATVDAATVDAAPTCAGTVVGGRCWYRGAVDQSCTTVCSTHGAVDVATVAYAGSPAAGDRTNAGHCTAIAAAIAGGFAFNAGVDNVQDPNNFGCVDEPDKVRSELVSLNTTLVSTSNALVRRYCACTQ